MEYWQQFIRYDHANEIMIAVGLFLVGFSILRIINSSLKLLFWVVLALLGSASLSYGFQHSPYDLPALDKLRASDLQDIALGSNNDVLRFLCEKLDQTGGN